MSNAWDRQPGEPERWFLRFDVYRRAGAGRSLEAVWNQEGAAKRSGAKQTRPSSTWYARSKQWRWEERASAWDNYLRDEDERQWAERREQIKADDWDMAVALREKARQMLMFPVTKVTKSDGDGVTIIEPANWTFTDAAKIADLASKMARLAADMNDVVKQEHSGEIKVVGMTLAEWKTQAEQRRVAAREAERLALPENNSAA